MNFSKGVASILKTLPFDLVKVIQEKCKGSEQFINEEDLFKVAGEIWFELEHEEQLRQFYFHGKKRLREIIGSYENKITEFELEGDNLSKVKAECLKHSITILNAFVCMFSPSGAECSYSLFSITKQIEIDEFASEINTEKKFDNPVYQTLIRCSKKLSKDEFSRIKKRTDQEFVILNQIELLDESFLYKKALLKKLDDIISYSEGRFSEQMYLDLINDVQKLKVRNMRPASGDRALNHNLNNFYLTVINARLTDEYVRKLQRNEIIQEATQPEALVKSLSGRLEVYSQITKDDAGSDKKKIELVLYPNKSPHGIRIEFENEDAWITKAIIQWDKEKPKPGEPFKIPDTLPKSGVQTLKDKIQTGLKGKLAPELYKILFKKVSKKDFLTSQIAHRTKSDS